MASSEISTKGNSGNVRGESFSSGYSEPNEIRNTMEGQKGHSTHSSAVRGNILPDYFLFVLFSGELEMIWSSYLALFRVFACVCVVLFGRACGLDAEKALYKELWHACAGPLVTVPREGDRVFYFPQGHIEQVLFHTLLYYFWEILRYTAKIHSISLLKKIMN